MTTQLELCWVPLANWPGSDDLVDGLGALPTRPRRARRVSSTAVPPGLLSGGAHRAHQRPLPDRGPLLDESAWRPSLRSSDAIIFAHGGVGHRLQVSSSAYPTPARPGGSPTRRAARPRTLARHRHGLLDGAHRLDESVDHAELIGRSAEIGSPVRMASIAVVRPIALAAEQPTGTGDQVALASLGRPNDDRAGARRGRRQRSSRSRAVAKPSTASITGAAGASRRSCETTSRGAQHAALAAVDRLQVGTGAEHRRPDPRCWPAEPHPDFGVVLHSIDGGLHLDGGR